MGWERDEMHQDAVYQRQQELERDGHSWREARRIANEQIVHDHDPRDEDPAP